jgi:hypothetical protein
MYVIVIGIWFSATPAGPPAIKVEPPHVYSSESECEKEINNGSIQFDERLKGLVSFAARCIKRTEV